MLSAKDLTQFYLNGEFIKPKSKEVYTLYNPKDNSVVSDSIPVAGADDVDAAVANAEAAFKGPWSTFTAMQRTECFYRLLTLLEERLSDILTLDSLTTGNPISLIPTREKNYIKNCLLYYGEYCISAEDGLSQCKPGGRTSREEIISQPMMDL